MTKTVQLSERQFRQIEDALAALQSLERILREGGTDPYRETAALLRPVLLRFHAGMRGLEGKFEK